MLDCWGRLSRDLRVSTAPLFQHSISPFCGWSPASCGSINTGTVALECVGINSFFVIALISVQQSVLAGCVLTNAVTPCSQPRRSP